MFNSMGQAPQIPVELGVMTEPNVLIVYSPRNLETQVIRPLVMNFTQDAKMGIQEAVGAEISSKHMAYKVTNAMKASILPDPLGFKIDENVLGSKYTFVLIITEGGEASPLGIKTSTVKHVLSGYFTEQPFSDQYLQGFALDEHNAINPNAVMVFTDVAKRMVGSVYNAGGQQAIRSGVGTDGIYSNSFQPIYGGRKDICTLTPEDLVKTKLTKTSFDTTANDNPFMQQDDGVDQISVQVPANAFLSQMNNPVAIDNHIQSPIVQLNKLIDGISETNMFESNKIRINDAYLSHRPAYGKAYETNDAQKIMVADQLPGREHPPTSSTIRFDVPIYVSDLYAVLPMMVTQYIKLDVRPQFDVVPQDNISMQTQMSNLATHVMSNICVDLGIASATLAYQSYTIAEGYLTETPQWFIDDVEFLSGDIDAKLGEQIQKRLLFLMEENLFRVLKYTGGDFEFLGRFVSGGDALIQLRMLDYVDNAPGYTTTPLAWGAAVSNVVGTTKHAAHNATQLVDVICENTGKIPVY